MELRRPIRPSGAARDILRSQRRASSQRGSPPHADCIANGALVRSLEDVRDDTRHPNNGKAPPRVATARATASAPLATARPRRGGFATTSVALVGHSFFPDRSTSRSKSRSEKALRLTASLAHPRSFCASRHGKLERRVIANPSLEQRATRGGADEVKPAPL